MGGEELNRSLEEHNGEGLFDTAAHCTVPKGHLAGPLRAVAHYFSKVLAAAAGVNIATSNYGVLSTSEGVVLSWRIHLGIRRTSLGC